MNSQFAVLKEINANPGINLRKISKICNISLGKTHAIIENLIEEDFLVKRGESHLHKYFITKKGLEYLEVQLNDFQEKRLIIEKNTKKPKVAVVLAAGESSEFKEPISLCKINNDYIINRTILQLKSFGITKIFIVIGYQANKFKEVISCQDDSIVLIENSKYSWTGTMASLSVIVPYIKEDFILIEGDIVIENIGIQDIIHYPSSDCLLITSESGSKDEAFVEIKNDKLFKISKDIHQLNRIDGEMIGISKLSFAFFEKMIEEYGNNQNPYLNYEYMILDISRKYKIDVLKIDNLLWHEIDSENHLRYIKEKLIPKIQKKELSLLLPDLVSTICKILTISEEKIDVLAPIGGMTNTNYKVVVGDEKYVIRIPGNGTKEMIDRNIEMENAKYANMIGVDAELLYFNQKNGIKVSRFIDNAETLTPDSAKRYNNMCLTTQILKKLHNSEQNMPANFDVYAEIEKYDKLAKKYNANFFEDYLEVKQQIDSIKVILNKLEIKLTPCHNDLVAENLIKSGENKMYLIDWEYAGMNDPMWDLAAHITECEFSYEEENLFLSLYFDGIPEYKYSQRILINKIFQDFLWSLWTIVKESQGDNFGDYGINRYSRAKVNLAKLFKNYKEVN